MSVAIIYDLSRLITRVLNATPNGIDRVDCLLAGHFLEHPQFDTQALRFGLAGPRLLKNSISRGATERVAAAWEESGDDRDSAYEQVVARLGKPVAGAAPKSGRIVQTRPRRNAHVAAALLRYGLAPSRPARRDATKNALYLNVTHFPLEWRRHVDWLETRRDVRPVVMIHDLLPLERPEWFWREEPARHAQRLKLLARRGAAAIVTSASVKESLERRLEQAGRRDLPILQQPLPVDAAFSAPFEPDTRLDGAVYFIVCGTIEPRKNHLMLLRLWGQLVKVFGPEAPKLLVVGKRGWNSAEIVAAIEDERLRDHVISVAGLPTSAFKRLLEHSRGLLAPSLAEGFGLPLAEALALGVPVIASNIPPFREQGGAQTNLDPQSPDDWRQAIIAAAQIGVRARQSIAQPGPNATKPLFSQQNYLKTLDIFLAGL